MKVLTIKPPQVKTEPEDRPEKCPHCGSIYLHRHGYSTKPVKDHEVKQVVTVRYKCAQCNRTFRHYPSGVTRADQSQRLIVLAAVAWALGLSTRSIQWIFDKFGAGIGKSTVLRDVRTVAEQLKTQLKKRKVRVLGLDGTLVKIRGQEHGIIIALDPGSGQPVGIAMVSEHDVKALLDWLEPLVKAFGVEVIVTDELPTYNLVARALDLRQAHCRFHLKRRVGRLIKNFESELGEQVKPLLDEVRQIIDELPQDGGKRLLRLGLKIKARFDPSKEVQDPLYRLKQFILRLSQQWAKYRLWLVEPGVPSTNNRTEHAIGKLKMRARTVRGFKTFAGVESALFLTCARLG